MFWTHRQRKRGKRVARTALILAVTLVLSLIMAACGDDDAGGDGTDDGRPDVIDFSLNWFPGAAFAPFFVAQDKGYYDEANLAVNIVDGTGSGEAVRRVDIGQADIAVGDSGVIINAIRGGADLKIVMMLADIPLQGIFIRADTGITSIEGLEGATIGAPPEDAARLLMPAVANAAGIDHDTINYIDIQPTTKYAVLESGEVDAVFDIAQNAPLIWEAMGGKENVVHIPFADYGVELYSLAIFTRGDVLEERGDELERFITAVRKGWVYSLANPQEALDIYQTTHTWLDLDAEMQTFMIWIDLCQSDNYRENGFGWISEEKMQSTLEIVQQFYPASGDMVDLTSADQVMTNELMDDTKVDLPDL
jgi:NitT/TauT family transport system substrate-binding protein